MMSSRRLCLVMVSVASVAASAGVAPQIELTPDVALADERISLRVTGLAPRQPVTVRATARDAEDRTWQAFAGFYADADGVVDLNRQRPVHGSYDTADPMGLIHSLDVAGEARGRTRFTHRRWEPWAVTFSVDAGEHTVASKEHQRVFGRGVIATDVRAEGLVGTFFRPAGSGSAPGVMVLSGSEGGLAGEDLAAVLASRGYATLALAYFGVEGLPPRLEQIPVEYFLRGLDWLGRQDGVDIDRIAILGTSKGAEAALLAATQAPRLRAVVAYVPSSVVWSCLCPASASSWSQGGKPVPYIPAATDPAYRPPAGVPIKPAINFRYRAGQARDLDTVAIPVERIRARLMLIAGKDDQLWHSADMTADIMTRLRKAGRSRQAVSLLYDRAGHLIGKTFAPTTATIVGGGRLETGGTAAGNAHAQADSWPQVLAFLKTATAHR